MHPGEPDAHDPADTPPATAPAPDIVLRHQPCTRCSYNLYGLPIDGSCPECGNAVSLSLRGDFLQHASPEYLSTLRSGLTTVLYTILAMVAMSILGVLFLAIFAALGGLNAQWFSSRNIESLSGLVSLALYGILFAGYLKLTAVDPGYQGIEKPSNSRRTLRAIVLAQAFIKACEVGLTFFVSANIQTGNAGLSFGIFSGVIGLAGYILWAAHLYVMMRYVRWLGGRVPDQHILRRTRTYMWLLPVLSTVGVMIAIGPLVALILYWNILDRFRKHLVAIQSTGLPAALKGVSQY